MLIKRIIPDTNELRKIKNVIISNFVVLKECFHHLQSSSKVWPYLAIGDVLNLFVNKLDLGAVSHHTKITIENICIEVLVQGELERDEPAERVRKIKRFQFYEILIRMALHMLTNPLARSK